MSIIEVVFNPEKIKRRREIRGLSQSRIAKLLGFNANTYAHWERGDRDFDINALVNVCRVLGIERLDELVERKKK